MPPGNLLILYLKHNYYDIAADLLAESTQLTYTYLTPELYEFIDAQIMVQTSPEEVRSRPCHVMSVAGQVTCVVIGRRTASSTS